MSRVKPGLYSDLVRRCSAVMIVSVVVFMWSAVGITQEAPPALEFSFSNPGARSMGLGGAFVALADDATAAFANPAGLVQLLRPEVSLELRTRQYSTPYTEGGRASGEPTGLGIDNVDGLRNGSSEDTTTGVSFASFVYPGNRWSLALYRHQLADFTLGTEVNGLFGDVREGETRRYDDNLTSTELDIVGTGISAAYQFSDRFSLGFGLAYYSGGVENQASVYWIDSYPDTFWEINSFFPERRVTTSTFLIDGTDLGFNAGFLWKFAGSWRLGGVYRKGPRFDYDLYTRAGPAHPQPEGTVLASVTDHSIAFPDVWGLGVTYRSPDGNLTVGFEWDRVDYSVIKETLDSPLADTSMVAIDDADELHLGVEYVFLNTSPLIAVRGGLWHDPDHRFRYVGDDPFDRALFPPGEDATHIAVGIGIAVKAFQVDVGADLSDRSDVFALSAIYSF
jgi:long-chain fatty acid transport protein